MSHPARAAFRIPFHRLLLIVLFVCSSLHSAEPVRIVLVAGEVTQIDRVGHHDYRGGVLILKDLLEQNEGVNVVVVEEGWPSDPTLFDGAKSIVFYSDGAGKQAYLGSPERLAVLQKLIDEKVGFVSIHQAVEFPTALARESMR
jgi:hypothetical protein